MQLSRSLDAPLRREVNASTRDTSNTPVTFYSTPQLKSDMGVKEWPVKHLRKKEIIVRLAIPRPRVITSGENRLSGS